jgi:hypothetical protein
LPVRHFQERLFDVARAQRNWQNQHGIDPDRAVLEIEGNATATWQVLWQRFDGLASTTATQTSSTGTTISTKPS